MISKKSPVSMVFLMLIYVITFGYIGAYSAKCADEYFGGNLLLAFAVVGVSLVVAFMLHVVLHEFGHFVCGRLTGYGFKSFRILNFMWQKDSDGKIRFYRFKLAGTGGQCLMVPPALKDGDMPYVLYNLGGVIFNLLLALMGMLVCGAVPDGSVIGIFGKILCLLGVMMALENGLPLPGVTNDGSNILELSKSKEARQAFRVQMMGVVEFTEGKRVREFPAEWFHMPSEEQLQNRIEAVMAVYVCDRMVDEHDFAAAQETIDSLLAQDTAIAEIHLNLLKTNALYCELVETCHPERVEAYATKQLTYFWNTMKTHPGVIRTQYAYEKLYTKNNEQAAQYREAFEQTAKTYPYACEIAAERELLAIADEKAEARKTDFGGMMGGEKEHDSTGQH